MKRTILVILSLIALTTFASAQTTKPTSTAPAGKPATTTTTTTTTKTTTTPAKMEPWPGVSIEVLTDNEHVKISKITMAPGSVADWHSHPQYTTYAVTDGSMKVELKDKAPSMVDVKAGQASWSAALTHKVTNVGKAPFTVIMTEIKEMK